MSRVRAALWLTMTGAALQASACGGDSSGPKVGRPAAVAIVSGDNQSGRVAEALPSPVVVKVADDQGQSVPNAAVTFAVTSGAGSVSAASVATGADGTAQTSWTLGTRVADNHRLAASVSTATGSASATFSATATAGPAASVGVLTGNGQTRPPGTALPDSISARVTDAHGNPVAGVQVTWSVTSGGGSIVPQTSVTNADGVARALWTLGPSAGAQGAQATAAGLNAAAFTAQAVGVPTITQVSPTTVVPGGTATITGTNFSTVAGETVVRFNASVATITQITATQAVVTVPCEPSGPVTVSVTSPGGTVQSAHAIDVPNPLSLAVGEEQFFPAGSLCRELTGGGRFMLAVVNSATFPGSTSFRLRGGTSTAPPPAAATSLATTATRTATQRSAPQLPELRHRTHHGRVLDSSLKLIERLGPPPRGQQPEPGSLAAQVAGGMQIAVNDTLTLKIPNANGNLCAVQGQVQARVVFNGPHAVILEDVAAPLAGKMDSIYQAMGQEFESVHWDILTQYFGNPLAYDAQVSANGRIYMLFSKVINDFESIAGFVSSGDFFPVAVCQASNFTQVFYGVVPTEDTPGYDSVDNPLGWQRVIRSIVVHEAKHITAFGEKFARNGATTLVEERWLEEATAVVAEELFARSTFGYAQNANTTFQQSLFCERRPDPTRHPQQCWHKPFIMYSYFALVHDYLAGMETTSPIDAPPAVTDDITYYGSAWALVRWAADQYGGDERLFFRSLIQERTLRGADNLVARTGKSFVELIADFALASALDDLPNGAGVQTKHTMPSWNTRDIYAGMNAELPQFFPRTFPLEPRPLSYGSFAVTVPILRAASAAVFELSGTPSGPQLLNLTSASGATPPASSVRVKLVRIE